MTNVKRVFFITKEERQELNKIDGYILHDLPHFELEDGRVLYGKMGWPDALAWWDEFGKGRNFDK